MVLRNNEASRLTPIKSKLRVIEEHLYQNRESSKMIASGFLTTLVLLGIVENHCGNASIAVCITNCVQCKQMFGPYFQGRACGDACIASNGQLTPDCNNPRTLGNFLKRLY